MLADEWRLSKLLHYWKRPEYWEESWRRTEIPVTQTPVKDHDLTLMWKTVNNNNNNNNNNYDNNYYNKYFIGESTEIPLSLNSHSLCLQGDVQLDNE